MATLAENPTLKAAIDTYRAELTTAGGSSRRELLTTIEGELRKIADRTKPDVIAVRSPGGELLAVSGSRRGDWSQDVGTVKRGDDSEFVVAKSGIFRVASAPIALHEVQLGRLELATALDQNYARELTELSGAPTVITSGDTVIASTLPGPAAAALTAASLTRMSDTSTLRLGGEDYATQLLFRAGGAAVFALDSIDASVGQAMTRRGAVCAAHRPRRLPASPA